MVELEVDQFNLSDDKSLDRLHKVCTWSGLDAGRWALS